jgi:hypothetical protein
VQNDLNFDKQSIACQFKVHNRPLRRVAMSKTAGVFDNHEDITKISAAPRRAVGSGNRFISGTKWNPGRLARTRASLHQLTSILLKRVRSSPMQQVANFVAEIKPTSAHTIANVWPDFPTRAMCEGRGCETHSEH